MSRSLEALGWPPDRPPAAPWFCGADVQTGFHTFSRCPMCGAWLVCRGATGRSNGFVVVATGLLPVKQSSPAVATTAPAGELSVLCAHRARHHHKTVAPKAKPRKLFGGAWPLAWAGFDTGSRQVRTCFFLRMPHQKTRGVRVPVSSQCRTATSDEAECARPENRCQPPSSFPLLLGWTWHLKDCRDWRPHPDPLAPSHATAARVSSATAESGPDPAVEPVGVTVV